MITVTGYVDGVAYSVQMDPDGDPIDGAGVITHASSPMVLALIDTYAGDREQITVTGDDHEVSFDNPLGVVAALVAHTEVVAIVGVDAPATVGDVA